MNTLDFIHSEDRDEYAVYLNGIFDDTLFSIVAEDLDNYSEGEYMQVRLQHANEPLEAYLRVHEEWPTRLRIVRDLMES